MTNAYATNLYWIVNANFEDWYNIWIDFPNNLEHDQSVQTDLGQWKN